MIGWAVDTTIAVSVLLLVVLAIRKPFAAAFGARAAYALWLAPALRAVTPPLAVPDTPIPAPSPMWITTHFSRSSWTQTADSRHPPRAMRA